MLDLKNLEVVELNAQEIQETEGGLFGWIEMLWHVGGHFGLDIHSEHNYYAQSYA